MRMKIHNSIGVTGWSLALLTASLSFDASASSIQVTTADFNMNRKGTVMATAYNPHAYANYVTYSGPVRSMENAPSKVMASPASEVDSWTLFAAVMGLVSMRLWRTTGKKSLPVIK